MMRAFLLMLALLVASWARADVQLVDPTYPFTVVGDGLAPLQVIVRDPSGQPVPGAEVWWYIPMMTMGVAVGNMAGCIPDAGTSCSRPTDSRGISTMAGVVGTLGIIRVAAYDAAKGDLGSLEILVNVPPSRPDTSTLSVISGAGQRAVAGVEFPEPFVVRLLSSSGDPIANMNVMFFVSTGTRGKFPTADPAESNHIDVLTDAQGYARSPLMVAGWGLGDGSVEATAGVSRVSFPYSITNLDGTVFRSFQDLWWSGPGENGWGMSITQHGDQLFSVVFAYDGSGEPTWYVIPGGRWTWGIGSQFGWTPAYSPRSSPYYAYDASQFTAGDPYFGGAQIDFHGDEATFKVVLDANPACITCAKSVTKAITRQPFQSDVPGSARGVSDIWWGGPSQNGWGLSITEHGDSLVAVWFTYGADGKPTWFVMPGGEWKGSTYSGAMYRTQGSPFVQTYDVSRFGVAQTGTFSLRFADSGHANFSWSIDGRSGSTAVERQPF
jgi:hypothetical protein